MDWSCDSECGERGFDPMVQTKNLQLGCILIVSTLIYVCSYISLKWFPCIGRLFTQKSVCWALILFYRYFIFKIRSIIQNRSMHSFLPRFVACTLAKFQTICSKLKECLVCFHYYYVDARILDENITQCS